MEIKKNDFISKPGSRELFFRLNEERTFDFDNFREHIGFALSGNSEDLSNSISEKNISFVINDSLKSYDFLSGKSFDRFDIFCDNSGNELLSDISLALFLIRTGKVKEIRFHLKPSPIFVSDAMPDDFYFILSNLPEKISAHIKELIDSEVIVLETNEFWDNPYYFYQLEGNLKNDLSKSDLWIIKGDINYRKFFEDRLWPFDTPAQKIADFLPKNALLLRVIKSELLVSVDLDVLKQIREKDRNFLTDCRWGLIQLI
jgi:damage-control phosphatase, subfamily III